VFQKQNHNRKAHDVANGGDEILLMNYPSFVFTGNGNCQVQISKNVHLRSLVGSSDQGKNYFIICL